VTETNHLLWYLSKFVLFFRDVYLFPRSRNEILNITTCSEGILQLPEQFSVSCPKVLLVLGMMHQLKSVWKYCH